MQNVYTVIQVNAYIKNMFTQDFMLQSLFVKGEISNCKYHSSGHIYFTLKDEKGTISCVMFAGNRANGLKFRLEEGQQIVVYGTVDVYERDGKYQMYAKQISLDGAGVLYERFERLKHKLEEMGMFDASYKQPIPQYVKRLGVVTAPTGAAVQDIINIATRRNPYVQIILYPAIVQGDQAAASIVNGIRALEQLQVDVMIVGRGGGSMEDLWAFNEECVAQAVFDCSIPIISAVGHETDTTMIDYVSDLRAPTPSAAAELAVYDVRRVLLELDGYAEQLQRIMNNQIVYTKSRLENLRIRTIHGNPTVKLQDMRRMTKQYALQMKLNMEGSLNDGKYRLGIFAERLKGLSPLEKLKQGYSYVTDENGKNVNQLAAVEAGDRVKVYVKDGYFHATVADKKQMQFDSKD